jgi:hypothetical protein
VSEIKDYAKQQARKETKELYSCLFIMSAVDLTQHCRKEFVLRLDWIVNIQSYPEGLSYQTCLEVMLISCTLICGSHNIFFLYETLSTKEPKSKILSEEVRSRALVETQGLFNVSYSLPSTKQSVTAHHQSFDFFSMQNEMFNY